MARVAIRTWNASLFDSSYRRWVYGQLNLSANAIFFQCSNEESKNTDESTQTLYVDFSYIISISKALSSLVFPAITVTTRDGNIFWFSSFQNRSSVFLILQHFYQASLHEKPSDSDPSMVLPSSGTAQTRTKFGTELLQNVHDSKATLQKAALSLTDQGHQLRNTALTMEELHEDLDVAERITSGIDSWLGRWSLPPTYKAEEVILVTSNDIPDILDVEVLFTQVTATKIGAQVSGVLHLTKDGISILDMKQKTVQHFKWSDVSRVRVVSPWEILVTRFLIGQPDLSYGIISISMPKVLRKLEIFAARKMEYLNPPEPHHVQQSRMFAEYNSSGLAMAHTDSSPETTSEGHLDSIHIATCEKQQQKLTQQEVITDAEISELTATLSDLKNLALDVQIEQDSQLESIDRLTDSVTRGNDRLKNINSRVGKFIK